MLTGKGKKEEVEEPSKCRPKKPSKWKNDNSQIPRGGRDTGSVQVGVTRRIIKARGDENLKRTRGQVWKRKFRGQKLQYPVGKDEKPGL